MSALVPLFGMLGVLATATVTWLVARRKTSGTVGTSDAEEIWIANRELREMLLAEAKSRTAENLALRAENERCRADAETLRARIVVLENLVAKLSSPESR